MKKVDVNEIFDFDLEVIPLLEVLVGKTLEVSMLEVMEEEEIDAIKKQQKHFEMIRQSELMEIQRLEADSIRKFKEKERRKKQEEERIQNEIMLNNKIASKKFIKNYLNELNANVMNSLTDNGYFVNPIKNEV